MQPEEKAASVTGRAGLPLVVEAFRGYRGDDLVRKYLELKKRQRGYSEVEMVENFLLLLASGGEHLEDFKVLGEDEGLFRLLARNAPSPDAARNFLLCFHDENLLKAAQKVAEDAGELSYVPEENAALRGLDKVSAELVGRMADPQLGTSATLDHDATIIDSHKQEAKAHYKGGRGYQPVAVLWAEQDLVVADEFRDGNVPAGKDNLRLIQRAFQSLPEWVGERNFRSDSACYEEKVLKWLANSEREGSLRGHIGFTISADMTKELQALCRSVLDSASPKEPEAPFWQMLDDTRANETAEWSEVEFTPGDWPKSAQPLRYLVIRFLKRQGGLFASGESCKYLAVVTNREGRGDQIIRWHWQKAGTIEHLHDETK
ncbi:MAG: transposase, partial [Myxococcota bacterium]|nr:transposase [Myxococcota bacterium]